ncbi:MAG: hypothetical protein ACM31C_22025 [Acidobacteriota bacterium]
MRTLLLPLIVACATPPKPAPVAPPPPPAPKQAVVHHLDDPDLNPPPRPKLLSIDWGGVRLDSAADALALWDRIAPTGTDWDDRLDEVPGDGPYARELAIALLNQGNFTCPAVPAGTCAKGVPLDVQSPSPTATLADPCLRRLLALWSIAQLDDTDLPRVRDALRAIAAIPPPESQLVASALKAIPETDQDGRLELYAAAWAAGQHELVNGALGSLDQPHLIAAATKYHIDGAVEILSADAHRSVYLAAATDEQMAPSARISAIVELAATADKLAPDVDKALATAAKSPDCTVAATAARTLDLHGDHRFVPKLPHTRSTETMMRSMCVLASFEQQLRADEGSYLPGYIPANGLEVVTTSYDAYSDPHTESHTDVEKPNDVVLPEIDDLVRAMHHCTGTTCTSDDHEFRFAFKPGAGGLLLSRLEVTERPPCSDKQAIPAP